MYMGEDIILMLALGWLLHLPNEPPDGQVVVVHLEVVILPDGLNIITLRLRMTTITRHQSRYQ